MTDVAWLVKSTSTAAVSLRHDLFGDGFQQRGQWSRYLDTQFGRNPSVSNILRKGGSDLSAADFQALYAACWIHFPVEKGSFMIELTPVQRRNIKQGYEKLGLRMSSHFSGHGRSAKWGSHQTQFLKGYEELLVQMEGGGKHSPGPENYLFLKAEGHPMVSYAHMAGWVQKEGVKLGPITVVQGTGKGETANEWLSQLGKTGQFGIKDRAAENFNPKYQALLRAVGLTDKSTTVQAGAEAIFNRIKSLIGSLPDMMRRLLDAQLQQALAAAGFPGQVASGTAPAKYVSGLKNSDLAAFLSRVIVPFADQLARANPSQSSDKGFITALTAAKSDLLGLAERLLSDAAHTGKAVVQRVSEEIRVSQQVLDDSLKAFVRAITT